MLSVFYVTFVEMIAQVALAWSSIISFLDMLALKLRLITSLLTNQFEIILPTNRTGKN